MLKKLLISGGILLLITSVFIGWYLYKSHTLDPILYPASKKSVNAYIPSEVFNNKETFNGKRIKVYGKIALSDGPKACTLIACGGPFGIENPCCNTCTGSAVIVDPHASLNPAEISSAEHMSKSIFIADSKIDCGGNECNIDCKPLKEGRIYEIEGKILYKENKEPKEGTIAPPDFTGSSKVSITDITY